MLSYVAKHSNQHQNCKTDQITITCINFKSKRSNNFELRRKHSKQRKTTKLIKLQLLASILSRNDKQCWVTSQTFKTTQNYKTTKSISCHQITMNLHRFDVITIKNVELRRNAFKTTQNYKSNQITMTCIDLMSKTSKQRKTTNTIKLRRFASIWRQNDLNNAKLQKRSNYDEFASIWRQND